MERGLKSDSEQEFVEHMKGKLLLLASEPISYRRTATAISYVTHCMGYFGLKPILVGGQALELYTFGHFTTVDVDFVLEGYERAGHILTQLGFERKTGRHWYHQELDLPIEIPDSLLQGSYEKVTNIRVDDLSIYVIGIEDLILDRLRAAVAWNSASDMSQASYLFEAYKAKLDHNYLEQAADSPNRADNVIDALRKLKEDL